MRICSKESEENSRFRTDFSAVHTTIKPTEQPAIDAADNTTEWSTVGATKWSTDDAAILPAFDSTIGTAVKSTVGSTNDTA